MTMTLMKRVLGMIARGTRVRFEVIGWCWCDDGDYCDDGDCCDDDDDDDHDDGHDGGFMVIARMVIGIEVLTVKDSRGRVSLALL